MEDIRDRLRAAFAAERAEHLAAMRGALDRAEAGTAPDLRDLFRRAHSLKGAARAVELPEVEAEAHRLETLLGEVQNGARALDAATNAAARALLDGIEAPSEQEAPEETAAEAQSAHRLVRVGSDALEALARAARAVESTVARRGAVQPELAALARSLAAAPSAEEVTRIARRLAALARNLGAEDAEAAHAIDALGRQVDAATLAPAADLLGGMDRMVREIAEASGRTVRLRVTGEEVEADRRVLDRLRDPLIHLLRNAIVHGVEPPHVRTRAGKPEAATIAIAIGHADGDLLLSVQDDGRGLDRAAIARSAGIGGPLPPDDELFARLFDQGLSTAAGVDAIAGRGVGLALVAEAAAALGGHASIAPAPEGIGTRAELRIPRTAIRQPLVMVEAGGERIGIPARHVRRLVRLGSGMAIATGRSLAVLLPGEAESLPAAFLHPLLGCPVADPPAAGWYAVDLQAGGRRLLLLVDAIAAAEPATVRSTDEIAVRSPFAAGAVIGGDGTVLVVLDAAALIAWGLGAAPAPESVRTPVPDKPPATILVVDDSITTRTLERSILEAQGYTVLLAVDGVNALETLRARRDEIALMVADVEMPRLDGFGLLIEVRNDPALANIPIVMMTSRDSPDDVRRGLDLGADAYVTKQEFEAGTLLATIARFV